MSDNAPAAGSPRSRGRREARAARTHGTGNLTAEGVTMNGHGIAFGISSMVTAISRHADRSDQLRGRAQAARVAAAEARTQGRIAAETAEMRLYLATLISLLIAKKLITAEEFAKIAGIIDAMDGVVDGRFDGEIAPSGEVQAGAKAKESQPLRELAAVVKEAESRRA